VVPSAELCDRIHARWPLRPLDAQYRGEVAKRYRFLDGRGEVGFVSSISEPFCGDCHRARVSADGRLFTCLFASEGRDLRPWLTESETVLIERIAEFWRARQDRYSERRGRAFTEIVGDVGSDASRKRVEMFLVGGLRGGANKN
jgi:cyclic pyranopterin phosphate synthase